MDKLRRYLTGLRVSQLLVLLLCLVMLTVVLIFPIFSLFSKAFLNKSGDFVGFANYIKYFDTPALSTSIINTIDISLWSTLFSMILGFGYAFALTRTRIKGKAFFKYTALIPIFIPTLVHALGLVYLFGKQGILTRAGLFPFELYGRLGIIISETIYTFPQAFLMFYVALEFADGRLYEAAESMGASHARVLFRVTFPEIKYTIVSAFFVCFTLAFTDFGAPKVIGGSFNVLATDVYKQVAGQFNFNMGAVVGTLLLIPAVASFTVDRLVNSKNSGTISARATQLTIKASTGRDVFFFTLCSLVTGFFLVLIIALAIGGLTENYPYNLAFTLDNFSFNRSVGGMGAYTNSLKMALATAIFGTIFVFVYAYMIEKTAGFTLLRRFGKLLSVLPLALPGMVIGIAFIFFFNSKTNPLNFVYGTMAILVIANILHYFSVPFLTASGCLKKLDREYESVSDSMNVPRWKMFIRVSVPLSLPAILEISMYFFVNAMVTVSAVVFLYSANFKIAAIAITHMEEAGDFGQAAAMSLLILLMNVGVRIAYEAAVRLIKRRTNHQEVTV
ncbi:MAG: putative 2-aminoethylphosphonate ABC transporter permease subunit [Propionibacteriaceae bacterium]|jgi:iron(III) transport system permease protein|nr:putative 2-aminoethylphosphonate ABC transporter permease subunit [Propionibacteriaceae bacterium]